MNRKTLIVTNSSLPHIEESESFRKAIQDDGFDAEIFLTDDGNHVTRQLGFQKVLQLINFKRIRLLFSMIFSGSISSILLTAPIPVFLLLVPFLKLKKVKIIYTFHEPYMPERAGIYYRLTNMYHSLLIPQVNYLLFYSENALALHRASKRRDIAPCHIVPLYKYREVLDKLTNFQIQQRKYISFVGNLGSNKGLSKFFDIAEKLPTKLFLLAGSGNLSDYENRIKELDNLVVVNRYLTEAEYFSYIDQSSYVILPYSSASQSGVLLDVMCRGGIAVCSDIDAFSEIVTDKKTGLIINYDSFCEDFLKKVITLGPPEQFKISNAALELYNFQFSERAFFDAVKNLNILW